jgi:uncharacterized protein
MFLINYRIRPSEIHGLGVFAAKFIPKETVVWHYSEPTDYRIPLTEKRDQFSLTYGYVSHGKDFVEIPGDGSIFINHSTEANISINPFNEDAMIANRDIKCGEEITCNYHEIDDNPFSGGIVK